MQNSLTVIDFFCWAWGFSEGFRQQWFNVIKWIDFWQPAIDTHNLNHHLHDSVKNVLDYWSENSQDVVEIELLEDSDIIIGSPSCISFSSSNKSWKAEKSQWIRLIETYLRVIAVKKHKKGSKLLAWYMENVPNSRKYVRDFYTFADLNLSLWGIENWKRPEDIAVRVKDNWDVLNAADYWSSQSRQRFVAWEWCETWEFLRPMPTHMAHITLWYIWDVIPKANLTEQDAHKGLYVDPNYRNLKVSGSMLTDHFYDTWVYKMDWEKAEYLKTSHPYMGKMSFPENKNRPCRTVLATRSALTREALIYISEYDRKWDWEYRLPTVREISSFMGFPYVYQFVGSEGTKWRQVWNAVSPHLSSALAKAIWVKMGVPEITAEKIDFSSMLENHTKVENLNTYLEKKFTSPKKRLSDSRFRRHPFKKGNMTVELLNYAIWKEQTIWSEWFVNVFLGTWADHKQVNLTKEHLIKLEGFLKNQFSKFSEFKEEFDRIAEQDWWKTKGCDIQKIYEEDLHLINNKNPINIIKSIESFIIRNLNGENLVKGVDFIPKSEVPMSQLLAMYSLWDLVFNKLTIN